MPEKVGKRPAVKRRPSFEIAADYVEFNFKPIIEADREAGLSPKELKKRKKIERQQRKQHHYLRNAILATCLLITIAITTVSIWWTDSSKPVSSSGVSPRKFTVNQGDTVDEVAVALHKSGFIRNVLAFRIYARLHGSVIQAGDHMLSPSYNMEDIVAKLTTADTDEVNVQIGPGLTLSQIKTELKNYDYTDEEIDQAMNATYDVDILKDKPAGVSLEGYIYPDTYRVRAGDGPKAVVKKALEQLSSVSKANGLQTGFSQHGLSFYQGLTLASIVTKEVQNTSDQKTVAGVFYNRLNAGMNLGSDVTYQYAYKTGLCAVNTPSDCDSSYNTRIHEGLPPGPIANPSLSAMMAVANPTNSNYYYFVAGEDGKTYFSETSDQHNQAVAEHCGSLCQ